MEASVIIPTCNRCEQLKITLESLVKSEFDNKSFEIIIVDNGSTDNTKQISEEFTRLHSHIHYVYDDVPGLLTGRHLGAKIANSDILVFIDDDIEVDKNWLASIVDTFREDKAVHLVGGRCLPRYESDPPKWLSYFWNEFQDGSKMMAELSLCDYGNSKKEIEATWIFGLNFSIRKSSFLELGGFHPDVISQELQYLIGDGETGLCYKAMKKGFKAIYNPGALIYHQIHQSRMTLTYFEKRYFYAGIADSYTAIRKSNGIGLMYFLRKFVKFVRQFWNSFKRHASSKGGDESFEHKMLKVRFRLFYDAGYLFHHKMAKNHPWILDWILKSDYFDYRIPKMP